MREREDQSPDVFRRILLLCGSLAAIALVGYGLSYIVAMPSVDAGVRSVDA